MRKNLFLMLICLLMSINLVGQNSVCAAAGEIFVAPNGLESNPGTIEQPTTLTAAITRAVAGTTIYMRDGTYTYSAQITIARGNDGSSTARKCIFAYGSEKPVLDFSAQPYSESDLSSNPRGLQINGHYWYIKGLTVKGAADNGIFIGGNYNIIENCEMYQNKDTGLQLSRYISTCSTSDWPSYNQIINCYSHDNYDTDNGEDADGFAAKLSVGPGNIFKGCIAAYNVDDGWDLYTKSDPGAISPVTIESCIAYQNGQTSSGGSTSDSDGNGFKLGGEGIAVDHIVKNCIAFQNKKHGFTYNNNPGSIEISNCTAWNNGTKSGSNFAFNSGTHKFTNNLSYLASSSDKTSGTDVEKTNVWWKNSKSENAKGLVCSDADFLSLTPSVTRDANGYPALGNFLKLASDSDLKGAGTPSGTDIGAIFESGGAQYPTPTLTPNTTAGGASSVTVTIDNWGDAPIKQYRIDNGSWQSYTGPVTVTSNCTIYAQGSDAGGNQSAIGSLVITNIGSGNILFSDSFENGSSAWTVDRGTWSVVTDGSSKVYYQSSLEEGRAYAGSSSWQNYSVEAKIKVDNFNGSNRAYVCGRYQDGNNFYAASISATNGGKIELRRKANGSTSTMAQKNIPISAGTWYTIKLEMNGSSIKMYVNGDLELSTTNSSIASGAIGLVPYKVVAKYDDIVVTAL